MEGKVSTQPHGSFAKMMGVIKAAAQPDQTERPGSGTPLSFMDAVSSMQGAFKFKTNVKASAKRKDSRWHHIAPHSPVRNASGGVSPQRKKTVLKIAHHPLERSSTQPSIKAVTEEVEDPRLFFLTPAFSRQATHKTLFRPNTAPPSRGVASSPSNPASRPQSPLPPRPPHVVFESRREERAYLRMHDSALTVGMGPTAAWFFRSGAPGPGKVYYKPGAGSEGEGGERKVLSAHEKGMEKLRALPPAMRSKLGGVMSDQTVSVAAHIDAVIKSSKLGEGLFTRFSRSVTGAGGRSSRVMMLEQWLECMEALGALRGSGEGVVETTLAGLGLSGEQGSSGLLSKNDATDVFMGVCNGEGSRAAGISPQVWAKRAWRARKRQQQEEELDSVGKHPAARRVSFSGADGEGVQGRVVRKLDAPCSPLEGEGFDDSNGKPPPPSRKEVAIPRQRRPVRRGRSASLDSSGMDSGAGGVKARSVATQKGGGEGRRRSMDASPPSANEGDSVRGEKRGRPALRLREGSKVGWIDLVECMKVYNTDCASCFCMMREWG
uniref:Uncharacterized protein n=1 Tax=Hemiselmis andersenii TaxID=464988 RepID=A0A7S1EG56_HEMAN|mmetsp:Transcript_47018/g.114265  ORF Transcript_47018/g.114265 Transcript_47018/m.114265 type:complete len:549 (+) Transcript_47018:166-1812(+)